MTGRVSGNKPPRVGRTPDILRKGGPHPRRHYKPEIDWDEVYEQLDEDCTIDDLDEGDGPCSEST